MDKNSKIFIAGASGMVGGALIRALIKNGYTDIIGSYHSRRPDSSLLLPEGFDLSSSISDELLITPHDSRQSRLSPHALRLTKIDLTDQSSVHSFFQTHQPDNVYLAAAKVGGIHANNTYPAEFIYQNLIMEANVIHASHQTGVQKLLFLGSSCIYPKLAEQPMREDSLLTGTLEPTNEPYAIAKIAGIKICESYNRQYGTDFRSVMPTNLYGPGDNFDLENSHVIPALLRRIHLGKCMEQNDWKGIRADLNARPINEVDGAASRDAILDLLQKHGINTFSSLTSDHCPLVTVSIWGSGRPKREFLHVDDMADACVYVMNLSDHIYARHTSPMLSHINVGTGKDCTIQELAETVSRVTGFQGKLAFDASKPDGTPRKLLDVSRLGSLGWNAKIGLEDGLKDAYGWFVKHKSEFRA